MRRIIPLAAIVLVLLSAQPAGALTFIDGDEPGVSHLDIRESERTYTFGQPPMIHLRVQTYDGWTLRYCFQASCTFLWQLDTRGGRKPDRGVLWYSIHRTPICEVYNLRTGVFLKQGSAAKHRRNAFCSFPRRYLDLRRDLRWRVHSNAVNDHDRAPNAGYYSTRNE